MIFGVCITLYSGIESAFGGWIAEYTRRLTVDSSTVISHAMGDRGVGLLGRARGRPGIGGGRIGAAVRERRALHRVDARRHRDHDAAVVSRDCLPVFVVAVACGLGLAPSFPVTMAALSREMPPNVAQPMIALGSLGAAIVPWLVGAISSRTGSLSSGLSALLALLAVVIVLHIMRVTNVART